MRANFRPGAGGNSFAGIPFGGAIVQRTLKSFVLVTLLLLSAQAPAQRRTAGKRLHAIADRFEREEAAFGPLTPNYFAQGTQLPNHSQAALAGFASKEKSDLQELNTIGRLSLTEPDRAVSAGLRERLEADLQLRVCRHELWDVNHLTGWQIALIQLAQEQPVATPNEREQALTRWSVAVPSFVDTEVRNLELGLSLGYSAPQSVVQRVIRQLTSLTQGPLENSPLRSPVERSQDPAFQTSLTATLSSQVIPALERYRTYLQHDYLPNARTSISVSDLPDGSACYEAFLRSNTTTKLTAADVYSLGERVVSGYRDDVLRIGKQAYGQPTFEEVIKAMQDDPANRFSSRDDLLSQSKSMINDALQRTAATLVRTMPRQRVEVRALPELEENSGAGSRMQGESDPAKPEVFSINLGKWKTETVGEAQVTVAHEVWPGHGLQLAVQAQLHSSYAFSNDAYAEGWARYAEGLAEEVGILTSPAAMIQRRLLSQGILLDPGLHAFHWTRQQAVDSLMSTGRYTQTSAESTVDRIAVMPGQLTAYDIGRVKIQDLRHTAEQALGPKFDLRDFNGVVLEQGNVPLSELQLHVAEWINSQRIRP